MPNKPDELQEDPIGQAAELAEEAAAIDPVVAELKETKDQLLRLAAEFDNFRKRSQRERDEIFNKAKCETLKALLPVMDNFERAVATESALEDLRRGVNMIYEQLAGILEAQCVKAFGAAGDPFDPNLHHAVMHAENPELPENVVAEVFTRGYAVGDKVIREAVVSVVN